MSLKITAAELRELNESVKTILGHHTKILVKYMIKIETKSDKTENRVLIFTPVRLFLLFAKAPSRIDCSFNYLEIKSIESKKPTHFSIATQDKTYSFSTIGDGFNFSSNADVILTDLSSAIKQIFPTVPLKYIIKKIEVLPKERLSIFSDELRPTNPRNIGPCGGFSNQYRCMCDYYSISYKDEVAWDIDTIYHSHDCRLLNLRDFDHLESKDLMAIISALEYNTFFRGLKVSNTRLSNDALDRILHVSRRSMWLEELHLEGLNLKTDFIHKLSSAVNANSNSVLKNIDLNNNLIEDKGATYLTAALAKLTKGLHKLSVSNCGITAKGVNQIAHSLSINQNTSGSLTYLNLSGNNLKEDINNLNNFLAQPNALEHLDISYTDTPLESLFGALLRGCSTHLSYLNVSHNSFGTKKGKEIPPSFKQFFTSSLCLKYLNMSFCKIPLEALKHLLLGLACNESTIGLHLDLNGNQLGLQGAHVLESCIHGVRVLQSLDIGDNNLDSEMPSVLTAIGKNPSIKSLYLNKSFQGIKPKYIPPIMDALINLIQKDDFMLAELYLSENKLKNDIHNFINGLGSNQHLEVLDISGNMMGDIGARLLAKALQINHKLRTVILDRNSISLTGYSDIVYALENNYSLKNIPFPLFDISPSLKNYPEKTDSIMKKMQQCLSRNNMGGKRKTGQGFRLQQGFMLSATHQLIDKLISETHETLSFSTTENTGIQRFLEDAENCKQLLPKLQDSIRCDPHPLEMKLTNVTREIMSSVTKYLEETIETMLKTAIDECPKIFGNHNIVEELRKSCEERAHISDDFLQMCVVNYAGGEMMSKINEMEQLLASLISDRVTDEVLEILTCYKHQKGNGVLEALNSDFNDTPEILRSKSNHDSMSDYQTEFKQYGNSSSNAVPHLKSKRQVISKTRPQSINVGLAIDNFGKNNLVTDDSSLKERNDSITDLPSTSLALQHLNKSRPKRKVRAPTKAVLAELSHSLSEGLEGFFTKAESEDSNLTPLISPTSEECSSLSFVDSPTISREDHHCDKKSISTSGETTPMGDSMKDNWELRSLSSDNLDKCSLKDKSDLMKAKKIHERHKLQTSIELTNKKSPSNDTISDYDENGVKISKNIHKLRPWSVLDQTDAKKDKDESAKDSVEINEIDMVNITPGAAFSLFKN